MTTPIQSHAATTETIRALRYDLCQAKYGARDHKLKAENREATLKVQFLDELEKSGRKTNQDYRDAQITLILHADDGWRESTSMLEENLRQERYCQAKLDEHRDLRRHLEWEMALGIADAGSYIIPNQPTEDAGVPA